MLTFAPFFVRPAHAEAVWQVDLHSQRPGDTNVAVHGGRLVLADPRAHSLANPAATGSLITPPRRLATATSAVRASVDATVPAAGSVAVEIRGRRADGRWSEWVPAGQSLPVVALVVQARITLTASPAGTSPQLQAVSLLPGPVVAVPQAAAAARTYRVFATREGLVGATTANGHVITPQDHFVALPSTRALAPKATGSYTVSVCAGNGRCEWDPVWDVGPWNIHDDYWDSAATRTDWTDLAQGMPEAQAAYSDNYNDGKDGFGRTVSNPAGIDLADGTFEDGLRLSDNAWVAVTFLWTTPAGPTGRVSTALNVRAGPHANSPMVGLAAEDAQVPIVCQTHGDMASGGLKKTDLWDELASGYYVSDSYVDTGSSGQVAADC